jgi:hypothetical protein
LIGPTAHGYILWDFNVVRMLFVLGLALNGAPPLAARASLAARERIKNLKISLRHVRSVQKKKNKKNLHFCFQIAMSENNFREPNYCD